MKKNLFVITACFLGIIFAFSSLAGAEKEGVPCSEEPTDDPIAYGDLITCEILPVGGTDIFRFWGNAGHIVVVKVTRRGGGQPCVGLYDPYANPIDSVCGNSAATVNATLDQTGQYTVLVNEWKNDNTLPYTDSYQCVGQCPSPPIPDVSGCIKLKGSPEAGWPVI